MTRKECYDFLKSHTDLKNEINSKGKNFTNISTDVLASYIDKYIDRSSKKKEKAAPIKVVNNNAKTKKSNGLVEKLIEVLQKKRLLVAKEVEYILN